ncbi:MAG: aminotransferase class IV [Spirochaetales bacterium]|nr:aminotransferase class IV [Spirochaetales bacterium]
MKINYNGEIVSEISISPLSQGFNYGNGFFTTIKVINGNPENMNLHLKRIVSSLIFFNFDLDISNFEKDIVNLVNCNNLSLARVKIIIFMDIEKPSYLITCSTLNIENNPVDLKISEFIRGNEPIYSFKSINYMTNFTKPYIIFKDHRDRVLETGFANIFCEAKDIVYTPPLTLPILPGTYREALIKKGFVNGKKIVEKDIYVDDLYGFDRLFLTNSIRGIQYVRSVNNHLFK